MNLARTWAEGQALPLGDRQWAQLERYLEELWKWNRAANLTGLRSLAAVVDELLLDSLLPLLWLHDGQRLLDLGSGAGFPGLPLKICRPGAEAWLVESRAKRVSFLRQVVRLLGLEGIHICLGRVEALAGALAPGGYDMVTARAMGPLMETLALGACHARPGGLIISYQGPDPAEVFTRDRSALEALELEVRDIRAYTLPLKQRRRNLVVLAKTGAGAPAGRA